MGLALTDDHRALEEAVDGFLHRTGNRAAARAALDGAPTVPSFWAEMVEMGWLGLHVPEQTGGSGYGLAELAIVVERTGRVALPGPLLPVLVVAGALAVDPTGPVRNVLELLVTGRAIPGLGLDGEATFTDGNLTAAYPAVLGGTDVDMVALVVGDDLVVVDGDASALVLEARPTVDTGRPCASLRATGVPATVVPGAGRRARHLWWLLTAAEAAGGAAACREDSVAYALDREAFGRPIGSFQIIKHYCADMLAQEDLALGTVWNAAQVAPGEAPDEAACAAAAHVALGALRHNAEQSIQVHGGIGFTWEHDAHLFLRRSIGGQALVDVDALSATVARSLTTDTSAGLELPPEAEQIAAEVRAFRARYEAAPESDRITLLVDEGYLYPHWPEPWGRGAGPIEQLVVDAELEGVDRASHLGGPGWTLAVILPTFMVHGTPEQIERWIRPTMLGELKWCQLFSEPGAGSDLASLTTRAEEVAGGWRLTGQKVWTSSAAAAQMGFALVRTDRDAPRHKGITAMVVDLADPGLTVRPLRHITGESHFNEVFLDDVFVPDADVVGEINGGWKVAMAALGNERTDLGEGDQATRTAWARLRTVGTDADLSDADRAAVGSVLAGDIGSRGINLRLATRAVLGQDTGAEANVAKLVSTVLSQRAGALALALTGTEGVYADGPDAVYGHEYLFSRALSIAGGTSEIVRNVVAERVLGLPR